MPSRRAIAGTLFGAALLVALGVSAPRAERLLRVPGTLQWIGGLRMQVMTDAGASVAIDLTQVDQSSYRGLRAGDHVVVDGVVSDDQRRLVARTIWRAGGDGDWTESP
jgi:hypothetical protein